MDMNKVASDYWKKNRTKGNVVKVTDYSFVWETLPDKNGKTEQTVFMESYFWEVGKHEL